MVEIEGKLKVIAFRIFTKIVKIVVFHETPSSSIHQVLVTFHQFINFQNNTISSIHQKVHQFISSSILEITHLHFFINSSILKITHLHFFINSSIHQVAYNSLARTPGCRFEVFSCVRPKCVLRRKEVDIFHTNPEFHTDFSAKIRDFSNLYEIILAFSGSQI